jgi:hypothetical protein
MNKILHLYWGMNQPLSYLRYLTVYSFHKLNPEWEIKVWTPLQSSRNKTWETNEQKGEYLGPDYFPLLRQFVHLVNFDKLGLDNGMPEVHKSDLFRWWLLGAYGGVWSDFDILYVKPFPDSLLSSKGAGLCSYRAVPNHPFDYLAIGFHTSSGPGLDFFMGLFELGKSKIPQTRYQAFGAELLQEYLKKRGIQDTFQFSPELVYPYYTHTNIKRYWTTEPVQMTKRAIGCHWYAGMPESGRCEVTVTQENLWEKAGKYAICKEAVNVVEL